MTEFNAITKSYRTVAYAEDLAKEIEEIYNILAHAEKPMRCKEIAEIWTDAKRERHEHIWCNPVSKVKHALTALKYHHFVRRFEVDGDPITVTDSRYVRDGIDNKPSYIEVDGVTYYRRCELSTAGHWEKYERTIIPKIAYFEIVKKG